MSKVLSRNIDPSAISKLMALPMLLYSLPDASKHVDAHVAFPGLGERWRVVDAVRCFEHTVSESRFLCIAGHNTSEREFIIYDTDKLQEPPYNLNKKWMGGVSICTTAANTPEQAEWVCQEIKRLEIQSLMLSVSPYHCLRAYLTLLKTCMKNDIQIPLFPRPVIISPGAISPEDKIPMLEMIPGEIERIIAYQEKGDVATYEELMAYLDWLWGQPILSNF